MCSALRTSLWGNHIREEQEAVRPGGPARLPLSLLASFFARFAAHGERERPQSCFRDLVIAHEAASVLFEGPRRKRSTAATNGARTLALAAANVVMRMDSDKEKTMVTILIVLAVLMLLGAIPAWPHSRNWGYGPSGGLGLVLLILVVLLMTGRL